MCTELIVMQNVIYFCQEIGEKCVKIYCVNSKGCIFTFRQLTLTPLVELQTYLTIYGF